MFKFWTKEDVETTKQENNKTEDIRDKNKILRVTIRGIAMFSVVLYGKICHSMVLHGTIFLYSILVYIRRIVH